MKHNSPVQILFLCSLLLSHLSAFTQQELITNIPGRTAVSLNGKWQYILDQYETGFYDYRYKERKENDRDAYWSNDIQQNKLDRKEFGYINKYSLNVPGDW